MSSSGCANEGRVVSVRRRTNRRVSGSLVLALAATLAVVAIPSNRSAADSGFDARVAAALDFAEQQLLDTIVEVGPASKTRSCTPRSTDPATGLWTTRSVSSWTAGFFPGQLWMMYDHTGNETLRTAAEQWTAILDDQAMQTVHHDQGFMTFNSFGQGYRVTGNEWYKQTALTGAASLATRFNPTVGAIKSSEWTGLEYPVIIDCMPNIEILFWASKNGPDPVQNQQWYDMAVSHADVTAADHVRADGSTYQYIDYDTTTGDCRGCPWPLQGYAKESTWSRGQGWGLYGFTMTYRETGEQRFLDTAKKLADYYIANAPADWVSYWDFDAPGIPNEPRDCSAAALAASALFELATLVDTEQDRQKYLDAACAILDSLMSQEYLSNGLNSSGLLLHGTGHKPAGSEIDVSLIYADYYFVEALQRVPEPSSLMLFAGLSLAALIRRRRRAG